MHTVAVQLGGTPLTSPTTYPGPLGNKPLYRPPSRSTSHFKEDSPT